MTNQSLHKLKMYNIIKCMNDTVQEYLEDQGGVATMGAAIKATSRQKVRRALESELVLRQGRSTLFLPAVDSRVVAAFVHRGCLTCVSALEMMGVALWENPERIHLAVSKDYHSRHSGKVLLHREKWLHSTKSGFRQTFPGGCQGYAYADDCYSSPYLASPLNATLRALQCVHTHIERVVILDSVLNKRLVNREILENAVAHLRRTAIQAALEDCDAAARSPLETVGRLQLREQLDAEVKTGVTLKGIGEVDFLIGNLIVEFDGYEYHCGRAEFDKDRARSREALLRGFDTMRFTYNDVISGRFLDPIQRYLVRCGA
ncbi:Uncharacterised protein [Mobiluncus curtisii]|nr:Uncharacterised protein [Mobiluncus curtisii]